MNHWPLKERCPMCQSDRPGDIGRGARWHEYCKEHLFQYVTRQEDQLNRIRAEIARRVLAEDNIGERMLTQHEAAQEKKGTESPFDYLVRLYEGNEDWDIDTLEDQILHPLFALGGPE